MNTQIYSLRERTPHPERRNSNPNSNNRYLQFFCSPPKTSPSPKNSNPFLCPRSPSLSSSFLLPKDRSLAFVWPRRLWNPPFSSRFEASTSSESRTHFLLFWLLSVFSSRLLSINLQKFVERSFLDTISFRPSTVSGWPSTRIPSAFDCSG